MPRMALLGMGGALSETLPVLTIIDDFNRADGALGSDYSLFWGEPAMQTISSNKMVGAAGAWRGAYWDTNTYGANCCFFVTLSSLGSGGFTVFLFARMDTPSSPNGYCLRVNNDTTFRLYRYTSGSATLLQETYRSVAAGDAIGIRCNGSTIEGWRKPSGGEWGKINTATDATYGSAGYFAIDDTGVTTANQFDDWGGGTG